MTLRVAHPAALAALLLLAAGCDSGDDTGPEDPAASGPAYAFANLQADGETPVSWRSCDPIPIDADLTGAPAGSLELYRNALAHTAAATGFTFRDYTRAGVEPIPGVRPVTVRWGSSMEVHSYGADLAAFTSTTVAEGSDAGGLRRYIAGQVVLDVDAFTRLADRDDTATAQGLLDHELGHLVGLDHVADEKQLMHAEYVGQRGWGAGDRTGLAILGRAVPCQTGSSASRS